MDFSFTPEQEAFRQEVRKFLAAERDAGSYTTRSNNFWEMDRDFTKKVAAQGWIGLTWPKEHGGQGRSYIDRTIFMEELLRFQAPSGCYLLGDRQVGPALMSFGTPEQRQTYLPPILSGEAMFCLLFSEPNAGSDLVSVQSSAVQDGDHWIINGQKVWTSGGHLADYGWMLARTDPNAQQKHKGLSEFIIDMKSPGVTVRPLVNIAGKHHFNEIFFDDVRVHQSNLVGQVNRGFYQIMEQMDYERAGLERLMQDYPLYERLIEYAKQPQADGTVLWEDPVVRDQVAQLEIEYQAGRLLCYYISWILDQGRVPNYEAAMCKAFCTKWKQKITEVATRLMGPYGQLMPGSLHAPFDGEAPDTYLIARSYTLQGGTTEVLKNIVARKGLRLPTLG